MLLDKEWSARVKEFVTISNPEKIALLIASLLAGFIFTIRHPGDTFSVGSWLMYFLVCTIIAGISFVFRALYQKVMGVKRGYFVEFQILWSAVIVSVLVALLTRGYVPLLAIGAVSISFMVKQRIGEFRYGYSYQETAMLIMWGVIASGILAMISAFLLYIFPNSYFFKTAMYLNLMLAAMTVLPIPQMDGMQLFFGDRFMFWLAIIAIAIFSLLLITQTRIGLIIAITISAIIGIIAMLWDE